MYQSIDSVSPQQKACLLLICSVFLHACLVNTCFVYWLSKRTAHYEAILPPRYTTVAPNKHDPPHQKQASCLFNFCHPIRFIPSDRCDL